MNGYGLSAQPYLKRRHDTQHNDIQPTDTQHNVASYDTA